MTSWLFLAPSPAGRAEARSGLHIAERLTAQGDQVVFLSAPEHALTSQSVACIAVEEGPLSPQVRRHLSGKGAVVLCDLAMTVLHLEKCHAHDALDTDLPVIGIDGWDLPSLGGMLDPFPDERIQLAGEIVAHERVLRPVPLLHHDRPNAAQVLPDGEPLSEAEREALRASFGLGSGPLAVICHEPWQHETFGRDGTSVLRDALAPAIRPVLEALKLEVLDLGPQPLPGLAAPHTTDASAIGAADLVLSTSVLSPWNAAAAVRGIPVVTLVHSGAITDQLPWGFQAWPASFDITLRTLLRRNRWAEVLNRAEIGEPEQLEAKLEALLPDSWARDGLLDTAANVLEEIRALPGPEDVLNALLEP